MQNNPSLLGGELLNYLIYTVVHIFNALGLRVFDVEKLPTHGGSLRVYGCHAEDPRPKASTVVELMAEEESKGLRDLQFIKIPFIMSSNNKPGGFEHEDIDSEEERINGASCGFNISISRFNLLAG